jgi:hypothetical protein
MNPMVYFSTVMPRLSRILVRAGCISLFTAGTLLRALDEPSFFVLNLPFPSDQATPSWLARPETPPANFARLDLPLLVPGPDVSLLVTVFFQEKEGGFLRISWQGTQGGQLLSDNFYEGIGMSNQRSLLISPETLAGDGTLSFQCGDSSLGIQRIKLEWLENKDALISPLVQDLLVTSGNGTTQPAKNLDGQPTPADTGTWQDQVVTVPVTTLPIRIEQGVEFSVQLDQAPAMARLALEEAGLPWGKRLVVWINQQRAGTITPKVPDLLDDGFPADTSSPYVGWRDASFYAPVALLKPGINTLQFSAEDEIPASTPSTDSSSGTDAPLAIKNLILQLNYPPSPPTTDAPVPKTSTPSDATSEPAPATPAPSSPPSQPASP